MPSPASTINYAETQSSTAPEIYYSVLRQDGGTDKEVQSAVTARRLRSTICGLKRNILWVPLIVALVVVIAIAGGVGGSLVSKRASKNGIESSEPHYYFLPFPSTATKGFSSFFCGYHKDRLYLYQSLPATTTDLSECRQLLPFLRVGWAEPKHYKRAWCSYNQRGWFNNPHGCSSSHKFELCRRQLRYKLHSFLPRQHSYG